MENINQENILSGKSDIHVVTPEEYLQKATSLSPDKLKTLQNTIIQIDFTKQKYLLDSNVAAMCIVVLTSDGKLGTLTHLQTDADVVKYANILQGLYPDSASTCIAGGISGLSDDLLKQITQQLIHRNFIVAQQESEIDFGGDITMRRRIKLFSDHVDVTRYLDTQQKQKVRLEF